MQVVAQTFVLRLQYRTDDGTEWVPDSTDQAWIFSDINDVLTNSMHLPIGVKIIGVQGDVNDVMVYNSMAMACAGGCDES